MKNSKCHSKYTMAMVFWQDINYCHPNFLPNSFWIWTGFSQCLSIVFSSWPPDQCRDPVRLLKPLNGPKCQNPLQSTPDYQDAVTGRQITSELRQQSGLNGFGMNLIGHNCQAGPHESEQTFNFTINLTYLKPSFLVYILYMLCQWFLLKCSYLMMTKNLWT